MSEYITDEGLVRLKDGIDAIRSEPEKHRQGSWILGEYKAAKRDWCVTGCCLFGTIALQAGATPRYPDVEDLNSNDDGWKFNASLVVTPEGQLESVSVYVHRLLGVSSEAADALAAGDNTIEDIEAMYECLANGQDISRDDRDL